MNSSECPFLVRAHEPTVASGIRREHGSEPPLHALLGHVERPCLAGLWGFYGRPSKVSIEAKRSVPGHSLQIDDARMSA